MNQVMTKLQSLTESQSSPFIRVLFGQSTLAPLPKDFKDPETGAGALTFIDPSLNDSQKDAIRFAMASREVALIHGPPGVSISPPSKHLD
jgi:DNA polymerase alpha-associated DNA helicase A